MSDAPKPRFRRVVRRHRPAERERPRFPRPGELWEMLRSYFGLGRAAPPEAIADAAALGRFLGTRASFIAQTSLYGYLRTRTGMRYPELFDDDPFVEGINIAKWHTWLDCLADLSVYAGSRLAQQAPQELPRIAGMINALVDDILARTGTPADAGGEFAEHAARVRERLARTDWLAVGEGEAAFSASPASVVKWSPVIDELKELDEEIVINSVRFRWQEVRRDFARHLDVQALIASLPEPGQGQV
jgi:hypothetical protein